MTAFNLEALSNLKAWGIALSAAAGAAISLGVGGGAQSKEICTLIIEPAVDPYRLVEPGAGAPLVEKGDCDFRATPASTTKIALAVMGYDSGFLVSPNEPELPFRDGYVDWAGDSWRQATDPTRWLKYSVVWYSQLLTHHLGYERLEAYARDFGFGNADFSGDPGADNGLDTAWISSSLKISPREQVWFLQKLVENRLPVGEGVADKVITTVEMFPAADGWSVHGKTGMAYPRTLPSSPDELGALDRERGYGWFVGWAEKGDRLVIFAQLFQDEADGRRPIFNRAVKDPAREKRPISTRARDDLLARLAEHVELEPKK